MTPEQEQQKAQAAQQWLDDAFTKEFRDHVYGQLRTARLAVPSNDPSKCADLIRTEQIADLFFRQAELVAQTGKFADLYLQQEDARRKSLGSRLLSYATRGRAGI